MPPTIELVTGDITTLDVDGIVNAANSQLSDGSGVNGAIHRAAGAFELGAACRMLGGCDPGDAVSTPGFALKARSIIHTVGPVWHGGESGEAETLARCYRSSLCGADARKAKSVAFPAISTGIYGFPRELAARIAGDTIKATKTKVARVILVAFDEETAGEYRRLLGP